MIIIIIWKNCYYSCLLCIYRLEKKKIKSLCGCRVQEWDWARCCVPRRRAAVLCVTAAPPHTSLNISSAETRNNYHCHYKCTPYPNQTPVSQLMSPDKTRCELESPTKSACVCVAVCVWERERERERGRGIERVRERTHLCHSLSPRAIKEEKKKKTVISNWWCLLQQIAVWVKIYADSWLEMIYLF